MYNDAQSVVRVTLKKSRYGKSCVLGSTLDAAISRVLKKNWLPFSSMYSVDFLKALDYLFAPICITIIIQTFLFLYVGSGSSDGMENNTSCGPTVFIPCQCMANFIGQGFQNVLCRDPCVVQLLRVECIGTLLSVF